MKVLEKEIALREQTRGLEQARPGLEPPAYAARAGQLGDTQGALSGRIAEVTRAIAELPDGSTMFEKEIGLLNLVRQVMDEAEGLLDRPETGPETIAAETHAIELLMQARRMQPGGGGGGGSTPGGGGGGDTEIAALALIGVGDEENRQPEERAVQQATGVSGADLPEEFRAGLGAFFNALENRRGPGGS